MDVDFLGKEMSLEDILNSREERAFLQNELVSKFNRTVVNFKLNIPGPIKMSSAYKIVLDEGSLELEEIFKKNNIKCLYSKKEYPSYGPYAIYVVDETKENIKKLTTNLEENHSLGRLFDIDVFDKDGSISRTDLNLGHRKCFMCENEAYVCGRSRRHSVEEMLYKIHNSIIDFINNTN